MSRLLVIVVGLWAFGAGAKPWNGIAPGISSKLDVITAFGEPSRTIRVKDRDVIVYSGDRAIKATVQVQFKMDDTGKVVDRIDVYPAVPIDREDIEKSYGPKCGPKVAEPCYFLKQGTGKKVYFLYLKLGLAIFFKDDGSSVLNFAFLAGE